MRRETGAAWLAAALVGLLLASEAACFPHRRLRVDDPADAAPVDPNDGELFSLVSGATRLPLLLFERCAVFILICGNLWPGGFCTETFDCGTGNTGCFSDGPRRCSEPSSLFCDSRS